MTHHTYALILYSVALTNENEKEEANKRQSDEMICARHAKNERRERRRHAKLKESKTTLFIHLNFTPYLFKVELLSRTVIVVVSYVSVQFSISS